MSHGSEPGLTPEQASRRERTLVVAIALSALGPFATGLAVVMSRSTTQVADFVRRTMELGAMVVSWIVFRRLSREQSVRAERRTRLESVANLSVAAAMGLSAAVLIVLAVARNRVAAPGGNVYPGLAIAVLGLGVNTWFWRRYASMTRERFDSIIATQSALYLGKSAVDLCVVVALGAVAIAPLHPATARIDLGGTIAVALYLGWCSFRTVRARAASDHRPLAHRTSIEPSSRE